MDAEDLKPVFFEKLLRQGIQDIFEAQRLIAQKNEYQTGFARIRSKREGAAMKSRSGALMEALQNPQYALRPDGSGVHADIDYPLHIRFLDMKRLGNWKIYNRQMWGILYKDVFVKMKYNFKDWSADMQNKMLAEAFEPFNKL